MCFCLPILSSLSLVYWPVIPVFSESSASAFQVVANTVECTMLNSHFFFVLFYGDFDTDVVAYFQPKMSDI